MTPVSPGAGGSPAVVVAPSAVMDPIGSRVRAGPRPVSVLVCIAMTAPIIVYLWVALHRVGYPFELDWMEGGSVELAARVLAGHSLYSAPSLQFVGWTYPPLYYWIAAGVAKVVGIGFLALRLVSLGASLASMATLAWIVTRETGDRIAGLVAAGLFAATFRISGAWFDTGRVDSLFVALTLLTLARGRSARGWRGGIALGSLAFLACFTKQTALLALTPALTYLAVTRRAVGISAVVTLLALLLTSTAVLDVFSHGWYRYYVVSELAGQSWARQLLAGFWVNDLLHWFWPLVIVMIAGGVRLAWRARARQAAARSATAGSVTARSATKQLIRARLALGAPAMYYAAAALGLIVSAWLSRLHTGGYANVLMPAHAAIAMLAGLAYAGLVGGGRDRIARPLLAGALVLQLALLIYPVGAQIPTAADRAAGDQLIAALRALPGPVVVLRHPWYGTLAGKGSFAQEEAIGDMLRSKATRGSRVLRASLGGALNADHVQAVVLDGTFDGRLLGPDLTRDFRLTRAPITPSRLYPLTDVRTAPMLVYLRVRLRADRPVRAGVGALRASEKPGTLGLGEFGVGRGQAG